MCSIKMTTTNNIKVKIAGRDFRLRTDDPAEYVEKLAQKADFEVRRIMHDNPGFGIQNASVIVALNAYDEAEKLNETLNNIRSQIASYVNDAAKARSAKERLSKKNAELEAEIQRLTQENKQLTKQVEKLKTEVSPFSGEQLILGDTLSPSVTVYVGDDAAEKKEQHSEQASEQAQEKAPEKAEEEKRSPVQLRKPTEDESKHTEEAQAPAADEQADTSEAAETDGAAQNDEQTAEDMMDASDTENGYPASRKKSQKNRRQGKKH